MQKQIQLTESWELRFGLTTAKFSTRAFRAQFAKKSVKREKEDLEETVKDATEELTEIAAKDAEEVTETPETKHLRLLIRE